MNADNNLDEVLRFEEMNIEIQLTDELSGSLRSLKVSSKTHWENNLYKQSIFFCLKKNKQRFLLTQPEGNLFVDRYKSLQRRNIIEPRKIVV